MSRGCGSAACRAGAGAAPAGRWPDRPAGTRSPDPARGRPRTDGRASTPNPATRSSRARALRRRARADAHGHDRRAVLAPTMPALRMPTANSAARSGGDWITKVSRRETCGPTIPTAATTSVTVADHDDGAPPADHQQQQREQEVQLGLDGHRPERRVRALRADDVLHQQAVDDDRLRVGHAMPGLRDDQPRHREAEGERGPVRREDAPGPPAGERARRRRAASRGGPATGPARSPTAR